MKIALFILLLQKHSRQLSNIVKITDFYMNLLQMMKLLWMELNMKYIVDMTLEVEETMALNVERSNSTNHNLLN